MKLTKATRKILSVLLCLVIFFQIASYSVQAGKAKVLLLSQAQKLAVSVSRDISMKYNEILLKKMDYVESVEVTKAKIKNKQTLRWTPLLNFKLPEQLDMAEEYDLHIKPLVLQTEIRNLQHEMDDLRYEALCSVTQTYIQVYMAQEKITFTQSQLESAQSTLERNKARLILGKATQTDVDNMEREVEKLTTELATLKKNFQNSKEELSDLIKLDVTSGYVFRNPLQSMSMPREMLDSVIAHTLANDQSFYEAKSAASVALMNIESYESLMKSQYGSKMNVIQTYIDMAKKGMDIDYAEFQIKYREFLKLIDAPWAKKIKILFFTFSMERMKGEIDGSRYIEDEMYAIYTACMEYSIAKKERDNLEKSLRKEVESSYENLVTTWNSYVSMSKQVQSLKTSAEKITELNKLGRASYEEVSDAVKSYQDAQLEAMDTLSTYNELLFDFDRLTCGAVTKYMNGESLSMDGSSSGDSLVSIDPITEPYYYISTNVADLVFSIGVSIPDDFEPKIDQFEVWNEGYQIGTRTAVGSEVTHLTLDYGGTSELIIRLYNGDEYVSECVIDATVARDVLPLEGAQPIEPVKMQLGTYTATTKLIGNLSTSELSISLNQSIEAESYSLTFGEKGVYRLDPIGIDETFSYLTLLISSLDDVSLNLYDENGELVETASFDTKEGTIYVIR